MKKSIFLAALVVALSLTAGPAVANGPSEAVVVSLGDQGPTDRKSRQALRHLLRTANTQGFAKVWVVLDSPFFPPYQGILSPEELVAQQASVEIAFHEILDGLVAQGHVIHAPDGPYIEGPTCAIKVSRAGLIALVRSQRLGQIAEIE